MHMIPAQKCLFCLCLSVCLSFTYTKVPEYFYGYNSLYRHLPVHRKHSWNVGEKEDVKIDVIFNNTTQKSLFEGFPWLL